MKEKNLIRVIIYLLTIIGANIVTARYGTFQLGVFLIPFGSFFIGLTLVMRDMVQNVYGRKKTYGFIALALILSAVSSRVLGDPLWIVMASTVTFLVSETIDTEIYTRFKIPFIRRVMYSGVASGFLDSALFVIIGISPFGMGFIEWTDVPYAILGQWMIKVLMQLVVAGSIRQIVMKLGIYEPNISDVR